MANKRRAQPVVVSSLRIPAPLAEWLNNETEARSYPSRHQLIIDILQAEKDRQENAPRP